VAAIDVSKLLQKSDVPEYPVGSLDELEAKKLPARVFPSCAEPAFDGSITGCPLYGICDMSYKGLPSTEGGGPRNHCWERIKSAANGGGIVRVVAPCHWGIAQQETALGNDEVLRPIADEGEEWEELTTVPVPEGGRDNLGYFKWETVLRKRVVTPFERVGKARTLAKMELRANVMAEESKRVADAKKAKLLGATGAGEPLDKRGKGSSGSPKKEG
jgi:hypothetical protein